MNKIRKGDLVQVMRGKDSGKRGEVLSVVLKKDSKSKGAVKVVIKGINIVKKSSKAKSTIRN